MKKKGKRVLYIFAYTELAKTRAYLTMRDNLTMRDGAQRLKAGWVYLAFAITSSMYLGKSNIPQFPHILNGNIIIVLSQSLISYIF